MEGITFEGVVAAVGVVIAFCGLLVTITKTVDAVRSWRAPQEKRDAEQGEAIAKNKEKLRNDMARLDEHDRAIDGLCAGQTHLCAGVRALLDHELHNGNADQMKAASEAINAWLIETAAGRNRKKKGE